MNFNRVDWKQPAILLALAAFGTGTFASAAAPAAKPNILILLADDMGFSDAGCYGGEIETPNIDRLAANGLRFTQFYNTARCWPTRSSLLTGYYAPQIHMDPPSGRLPAWTRVIPHYLKPLGYRCYHSGKWHLFGAPRAVADAGFDHSYKLDDQDRFFSPKIHFMDDKALPPVAPGSGFYATRVIADHAIEHLADHAKNHSGVPFFSYVAFTSPHFPLQALPEDIARYRDRYRDGWDAARQRRLERARRTGIVNCDLAPLDRKLSPRYYRDNVLEKLGPGEIRYPVSWNELTPQQRQFQADKMAIHAAMVDRMDREIGRIVDQLRRMDAMENTVIFFLSDNGADATVMVRGDGHDRQAALGSAQSYLCIGPGFASLSNAPLRRYKVWVSEGGISTPLVVHWPKGIAARGELRHDMGHVVDFVPTLLELAGGALESRLQAGIPAKAGTPTEAAPPLSGRSLVPALARDGSVAREFLYFHHEGNRALRMGDWKLVSAKEDDDKWELFDLAHDRCERINLAAREPQRVKAMAAKWTALEEEYRRQAGPVVPLPKPPGKVKAAVNR